MKLQKAWHKAQAHFFCTKRPLAGNLYCSPSPPLSVGVIQSRILKIKNHHSPSFTIRNHQKPSIVTIQSSFSILTKTTARLLGPAALEDKAAEASVLWALGSRSTASCERLRPRGSPWKILVKQLELPSPVSKLPFLNDLKLLKPSIHTWWFISVSRLQAQLQVD